MRTTRRLALALFGLGTLLACLALAARSGDGAAPIAGPPVVSATPSSPPPERMPEPRYRIADCHLHLVDFLQTGDDLPVLLQAMDRAGVEQTMISGMPLVKKWDAADVLRPIHYRDDDSHCYWYSATDVLVARAVGRCRPRSRRGFFPSSAASIPRIATRWIMSSA